MSNVDVYRFKADMTCEACVNAIKKSLTKQLGKRLISVNCSLETGVVTIELQKSDDSSNSYEQVYEALCKTGRTITKLD